MHKVIKKEMERKIRLFSIPISNNKQVNKKKGIMHLIPIPFLFVISSPIPFLFFSKPFHYTLHSFTD